MTMLTRDSDRIAAAAPRNLRAESVDLTTTQFRDRYCDLAGPLQLTGWSSTGSHNGAFRATLAFSGQQETVVAAGSPVAAMTSALYDAGYPVEILQFHQRRTESGTATFVRCEFNGRRGWGAALATDGAESSVRAMIAAVNGLDS